jgi:hypothetical protein
MAIQNNFPSVKPSLSLDFAGSKALDSRITFSRASTGTYWDGRTVAKAEENLLLRSQEFENAAWSAVGTAPTITANAGVAPDGTSTADQIVFPAADSRWRQGVVLTNGTAYTISIYARSNTGGNQTFRLWGQDATFNSADLTATTSWQRFVYTFTATSSASFAMGIRTSVANAAADLLIWGMQVEARSSETAYTPTTTQPITNYIPVLQTAAANVARFDHNPVTGESLGLLIEEQRTNLLLRSAEFDNASWTKTGATVTANTIVAPDGTLTGEKLVETTTTGQHLVSQAATVVAATSYTISVYAKAAERSIIRLGELASSSAINVDLSLGTIVSSSLVTNPQITPVGNGWYRISGTFTSSGTTATFQAYPIVGGTSSYLGVDGNGIYIWGAQLEVGAFPTSYIKTEAAQATRQADAASMTGTNFSSWYRADEGSLYVDMTSGVTTGSKFHGVYLYGADASSAILVANYANTRAEVLTTGFVQQALLATTLTASAKAAVAYKTNDIAFSVNGGAAATDTSAVLPTPVLMRIGWNNVTNQGARGYIRKIAYYPEALTATQLQAITS